MTLTLATVHLEVLRYLLFRTISSDSAADTLSVFISSPRDGKQLRVLCEDLKYDFNLQETRSLPEVVIFKPVGDSRVFPWGTERVLTDFLGDLLFHDV